MDMDTASNLVDAIAEDTHTYAEALELARGMDAETAIAQAIITEVKDGLKNVNMKLNGRTLTGSDKVDILLIVAAVQIVSTVGFFVGREIGEWWNDRKFRKELHKRVKETADNEKEEG